MLKDIIIYRVKMLLRGREYLFWCFLFPIILGTLFNMTLKNIMEEEVFKEIPIAMVNAEGLKGEEFISALRSVAYIEGESEVDSKEQKLFKVRFTKEDEAKELLSNNEIIGYILAEENNLKIVAKESGNEVTILKSFIDQYKQQVSTITNVMKENNGEITGEEFENLLVSQNFLKSISVSKSAPNTVVIYFYTILAMAGMFSATVGINEIMLIEANQSYIAARINLVPRSKVKLFIGSAIASIGIQILILNIVFAYLALILKIDFGKDYLLVMLVNVAGVFTGTLFGTVFGSVIKGNEGLKTGAISGIIMFGCYLAGMMDVKMKFVMQTKAPILDKINPVSRLTDAYYSLYYYDTRTRYWENMAVLGIMCFVFLVITIIVLRRQEYESI